ncbi:MAG: sigma-70 family RNA polymerase sigma factor [Planctomycetes bacterium]|nr:sigma-70 family RNA polymerase sigma factor [Planctomycetota bacterium]
MRPIDETNRLVAKARAGCRRSFGSLWKLHERRVRAVVEPILREAADDVVQDVAAAALVGIGALRDDDAGTFDAWLRSIARNRARSALGRRRRTRSTEASEPPVETALAGDANTFDAAQRDEVRRALRALPQRLRAPLVLRYWRGRSGPEIASQLHTTCGSLRVSLCVALRRLRKNLARCG